MLILTTVSADNQPVPSPIGGADNRKFSINGVDLGLKSDQVSTNTSPSIAKMEACAFEVDGDSDLWNPKNSVI